MNKLFIFCTLLIILAQPLSAQSNLFTVVGNDNSHGSFNTSYGFLQNTYGDPPAFPAPYTAGTANTFIGANSGNGNYGSMNTALGAGTGGFFLTGSNNVFIGAQASYNPSSTGGHGNKGSGNSLVGYQSGYYNQADYNVFMGYQSGYTNTTGSENTFLGNAAGRANTTGDLNTFVGSQAGYTNTTGRFNSFLGYHVGQFNTTGSINVFLGAFAGSENTSGQRNTFLGTSAGYGNTTGSYNVFAGNQSGNGNTTGYSNVALGISSGYWNQSGHNNVAIGDSAGYNATVSANTFVGSKAGYNTLSGSQNTFLGYRAGYNTTTGSNNIIIGPSSGTAITDGNDNVLMGYNSQAEDGLKNATAIGANSRVASSNALVLGHQVNVGIGTSTPSDRLEVVSDKLGASGLRLTNLTSSSPATQSTDQFLTVNQQGEIVKARYQLRISDVNQWSDNVFSPAYSLRPLASVAAYIGQHGHLPGVPSADEVVKQGVDLVKMNATLLEKVEELTLYSIQQQQQIDELKQLVKQLVDRK